jgi:hypothetical protein
MSKELVEAARNGHILKFVNLHLRNKNLIDFPYKDVTPLLAAVIGGNPKLVTYILEQIKNPDVVINRKDSSGMSVLDHAMQQNDSDILAILMSSLQIPQPTAILKYTKKCKILNYPVRPIPTKYMSKQLIKELLNIQHILTLDKTIIDLLKAEFGDDTVERFRNFLINSCSLDTFFPKSVYLNTGAYGAAFCLCLNEPCDPPLVLKIVPFKIPNEYGLPKYSTLDEEDPSRPENVEWNILVRINKVFFDSNFHHIPIAYNSFKCSNYFESPLSTFLGRYFFGNLEMEAFFNARYCRISFIEHADCGSLLKFLGDPNHKHLSKNIVFQVILAMTVLQSKIPGFRHNDFHIGNLLIRSQKAPIDHVHNGVRYYIESPRVAVLLNDFDFSMIINEVPNAKYEELFSSASPGKYIDMFKFFNHLVGEVIEKNIYVDSDVIKFAKTVLPEQYAGVWEAPGVVSYWNLIIGENELIEKHNLPKNVFTDRYPEKLIEHPFFSEFIFPT